MKIARQIVLSCKWVGSFAFVLWVVCLVSPGLLHAQLYQRCPGTLTDECLGQKAVWASATNTNASASSVDASLYTSGTDICGAINKILTYYGSADGVVVDARAVNPGSSSQACGTNPWNGISKPSVVLLPPGTITTTHSWILPGNTTVIGAGVNGPTVQGTTVQASTASFSGSAVIQMGGGSGCAASTFCYGVVVRDLTIDAQNLAVDGIDNYNAEELSYAKRVSIKNIGNSSSHQSGLLLSTSSGGKASHSGPYEDLTISVSGSALSCIDIFNAQPKGIHGVTCTNTGGGAPTAGIYLDGSNVSIEDANITGSFTNGILVGFQAAVYGDVLFNIHGSGPTNVVQICCNSSSATSDLAIMGVTIAPSSTTIVNILDQIAGTSLSDPSIGMYLVGEPVSGNGGSLGNSRFSTSVGSSSSPFPSWIVGSGTPSHSCGTGSLYSRIANSSSTYTLWGCAGGTWRALE